MRKKKLCFCIGILSVINIHGQTLLSPNGRLKLNFKIEGEGVPFYDLHYKDKTVLKDSKMGFAVKPAYSYASEFKTAGIDYSLIKVGHRFGDPTKK